MLNKENIRKVCINVMKVSYNTWSKDNEITPADVIIPRFENEIYKVYKSSFDGEMNILSIQPYIEQVSKICLCLSQNTIIGYYSILMNQKVRREVYTYILNESEYGSDIVSNIFNNIANSSIDKLIPEVFHNKYLTDYEKESLENRIKFEYSIIYELITSLLERLENFVDGENVLIDDFPNIYKEDYKQVCIKLNKDIESLPIEYVYYREVVENFTQTFCADTIIVLVGVVNKVNPLTLAPMSEDTIKNLNEKYPVEIKLVKYALDSGFYPSIN